VLGVLEAGEAAPVDELRLEGRDPGLGERVVVGVSPRADRGREPELVQAVGVGEARVRRPSIAVRDQLRIWPAQPVRHLEGVEDELAAQVGGELPADDRTAVAVEDEGELAEALPGAEVGEVAASVPANLRKR
jgi:hypothetical protein